MLISTHRLVHSFAKTVERCEQRKVADGEGNGELLDENNQDDGYIIDESKLGPPFGIVINGHSLVSVIGVLHVTL